MSASVMQDASRLTPDASRGRLNVVVFDLIVERSLHKQPPNW
jgi:hypothetical protein